MYLSLAEGYVMQVVVVVAASWGVGARLKWELLKSVSRAENIL